MSATSEKFNIPRTSLYDYFNRFKLPRRKRKKIPVIFYKGEKYTLRTDGYYKSTTSGKKLHREIYKDHYGEFDKKLKIVFKDNNKNNLNSSNLIACTNQEAPKYQTPTNRYIKLNPKLAIPVTRYCEVCSLKIKARNNSELRGRKYCSVKCTNIAKTDKWKNKEI